MIAAGAILIPRLGKKAANADGDAAGTAGETQKAQEYDLGKYLIVSYEGADGSATANLSLDRDKLMRDVCSRLKVDDAFLTDGSEAPKEVAAIYRSLQYAEPYVELDDSSISSQYSGKDMNGLKNGDQFVVTVFYDAAAEDGLLQFKDARVTVSGLTELAQKDPFEGFNLYIDGYDLGPVSGNNYVYWEYEGEIPDLNWFDFAAEPTENVKNGDVVTVRLNMSEEAFADQYQCIPTAMEKTFSIHGLPSFVTSFDEISKTALEELKSRAKEAALEELAKLDGIASYTEPSCIGYIFIREQDEDAAEDNTLCLVFRSDIAASDPWTAPQTYFFAEEYTDILDTDDAAETVWRHYSINDIISIKGSKVAFLSGIDDPWEFVENMRKNADSENQTLSFGGEMEYYSEGDGTISELSDISAGGLASIRKFAAESVGTLIANEGKTLSGTPECLGEYLIQMTGNRPVLVLLCSAAYTGPNGAEQTVYVPVEYDGVRNLAGSLLIDNAAGPMINTQTNEYGFPDLAGLHQALIKTGKLAGEITYSDSIAALIGE